MREVSPGSVGVGLSVMERGRRVFRRFAKCVVLGHTVQKLSIGWVCSHLSMEFTRTIRTTQVDKNPIHTGHPSPAEILLYSCGTDRPDRLLYLYHAGWPGLSCREVDLDIGVNAAGMIRIGRG